MGQRRQQEQSECRQSPSLAALRVIRLEVGQPGEQKQECPEHTFALGDPRDGLDLHGVPAEPRPGQQRHAERFRPPPHEQYHEEHIGAVQQGLGHVIAEELAAPHGMVDGEADDR